MADKPSCETVLRACDDVVTKKNTEIELCNLAVKRQTDYNESLLNQVHELQDSANAWYKNPYLLLLVGAAAGIMVVK